MMQMRSTRGASPGLAWLAWSTMVVAMLALAGVATANDDGPPHRRDRGHAPPHERSLSPQELDEALAVLREVRSPLAERLSALRREHPERAAAALQHHFPRLRQFLELKRIDPEMFDLRVQDWRLNYRTHALAERLRQAEAGEPAGDEAVDVEALRAELRQVVTEHFDVRQRIRERELAQLEQRIAQLREQLRQRAEARNELIAQRLGELTDREPEAEW